MIRRFGFSTLIVSVLAVLVIRSPAMAQTPAPAANPAPSPAAQPSPAPPPQPPQERIVMPDQDKVLLLIRTSLLTLNDALQTGNYTVLRDVAAPAFRETNSSTRLAQIFGGLAQNGVDLSLVAVLSPQLSEPPSIDPKTHMLHLKGYYPGQPVQLNFELLYQPVAGRLGVQWTWR
jgi:hypothetical protein